MLLRAHPWILAGIGALALGYAAGRMSAPDRVEIKREVVEVTKTETLHERSLSDDLKTTEVEISRPDGTHITTHVTERVRAASSQARSASEISLHETESKVSVNRRVQLAALAGIDPRHLSQPVVFGVLISKPVIGPVSVGAWALNSGVVGVSVGLEF